MICQNCGADVRDGATVCGGCGYEIAQPKRPKPEPADAQHNVLSVRVLVNALLRLGILLFSIAFFGYIIYTAYFWYDSWRTDRIYSSGALREPDVVEIDMAYGQVGHSLTFFGNDGDELFIPELNRSFPFVGGLTQIDIQDSSWFDLAPEGEEAAIITLTPVIYTQGNGRIGLPPLELEIETPRSPLELVDPKSDRIEVDTSVFVLRIKVVPGSKVLINGEDLSAIISTEAGMLEANLQVYPIGDNPISINVSTPHHRQVRRDIVLYRAPQTIQMERDMTLVNSTTKNTATISGRAEPGANIVVDTKYVEGSLKVEPTGKFSFKANLTIVGDNLITWHATMDGRADQYASYTVYYVPTLAAYSRNAWALNTQDEYDLLVKMTPFWEGQEYLCRGPVVEVFEEEGVQYVAIDVAEKGAASPRICVLENKSGVKSPEVGKVYRAYADIAGLRFYGDSNCPLLICRYMPEQPST